MTVKITYFVHGTTIDNESEISSGWKDVELSDLGIQQSLDLKDKIKIAEFNIVFCSDLKRAVESAKLTFGGILPIQVEPRLRECNYGDYNGQPSKIVDPIQPQYVNVKMPNGESYEGVKSRMMDFLDDLRENHDGKHIAIVAHKAPQLALDVILKGKSWQQAFAEDWRKTKAWQPGWEYEIKD